ncbi:HugZ family protein [Thalassospira mesophila]|uniref:Uncharacterized protein n=1 Tax=Thalassospira mesophila TaxID=1293891 RepID=A0A1Y2KXI9_9PROT|nr:DUF2470 domain-containing protein [Thalassospira mesophila]OSQ37035.1 hypothetical protein TMES_16470 [Thalassospira mesophila]
MKQPSDQPGNDTTSLRRLMRNAHGATLATLACKHGQVENGWPVTSMVHPVIYIDGTPIILISELADHTRHIHNDPRVSLLFRPACPVASASPVNPGTASSPTPPAPLTATQRLTVFGTATRTDDDFLRRYYLACQPDAALYAGFGDFGFYRVNVVAAYWVGGFGKQRRLRGDQLVRPDTGELAHHHDDLVHYLNSTAQNRIDQIVAHNTRPGGDSATGWKVVTIDCDGMNLTCNDTVLRIDFPHTISSMIEGQKILVEMGQKRHKKPT